MRRPGCIRVPERTTTPFTLLISQNLLRDEDIERHVCGCDHGAFVVVTMPVKIVDGAVQGPCKLIQCF
ncbi:MAG: hypothetical protein WCA13_01480 [Terriglobales bacterium]